MSIVDDDTLLRRSQLEAMRQITLEDATEPEDVEADPLATDSEGLALRRLGHYVLLSKLGQGGMGVVYAAFDEQLDRKVALKLLRSGGDDKARRRLVREAQSMARLSHPNVVQIYEIGESEGLIFLVMEFVAGQTLKAWLGEERRSRAEILAVFEAAGHGLAAAHAEGLVHRDFKPDNVMIREDGRVLVMDFGLAHVEAGEREPPSLDNPVAEPSGLTATGMLTGTPGYMAPEQFEGRKTDARTDQFAFCVALWEALHGRRPFVASSLMDLSVAVCSGSITTPEHTEVPTWLRRVLERGLEVEAERRWPSIDALLDELRRDPTRRRRAVLVVGALVAALGLVFGALELDRRRSEAKQQRACEAEGRALTWNEDVEARLEHSFAMTEVAYAPAAWERTRALLADYAHSWSEARTRACTEARVEGGLDEASLAAISACLDERRAAFEGLLEAWSDIDEQSLARATSAASRLPLVSLCTSAPDLAARMRAPEELAGAVAELRARLEEVGALEFAGEFEAGLPRAQALLDEAEELGWPPLIAEARLGVANFQMRLGDYEPARAAAEQAYLEAVGCGHELVSLNAATMLSALVGDRLSQVDAGLYWGELGLRHIQRIGLSDSGRHARLLDHIGSVHSRAGSFDEALALYEQALEILRATFGPEHLHVASALNNAGGAHWGKGDYEPALTAFREALEIRRKVLGPEHPSVATTINNIGAVYWGKGDYEQALGAFREALRIREAALGPDHPEVASSHNNVGAVLAGLKRHDEALEAFRAALAIQERTIGAEHPDNAGTLINVAAILRTRGELQPALETIERALAIWEQELGSEHPGVALALNNIGIIQHERGEFEEALASHRRALVIREANFDPDSAEVAMSLGNIGIALAELGELDEAEATARRSLALREAKRGGDHTEVAESYDNLGFVLMKAGELEQALAAHARALKIYERAFGPEHLDVANSLVNLGEVRLRLGELEQARDELERAVELREEAAPLARAEARFLLARVLWDQGERTLAREQAELAHDDCLAAAPEGERELRELTAWLDEHP